MRARYAFPTFAIVAAFLQPQCAFADGGTLQLSQRAGEFQISVFMSPAAPRVGQVDISVLVQAAQSGTVQADVPISISMENVDRPAIPLTEHASSAAATNKLFQSAMFDVPQPGTWRVKIAVGDGPSSAVKFDLTVNPPLPSWLSVAPWIGWPLAVIALFFIHQWLKMRRAARRGSAAAQRSIIRHSRYNSNLVEPAARARAASVR